MKVFIDPQCNLAYSSFYIKGLRDKFGSSNVFFKHSPFSELSDSGKNLRFVIGNTKYVIHTDDSYHIHKEDYEWCDVYGHVNQNHNYYPLDKYPKIVSLVPSFAIDVFNIPQTGYFAMANFARSYHAITNKSRWNEQKYQEVIDKKLNIKRHFYDYLKNHLYRCKLEEYSNDSSSMEDYIFFLSTLWYNNNENNNDNEVNQRRLNFIRAVRSFQNNGIRFDGGLLCTTSHNPKFDDVITTEGVPLKEWIRRTKMSTLVFNTPAFWNCHGWKLGEYLAMGKCILSTPLLNDLPAPLVHGENIHLVECEEESIKEGIRFIIEHPDYRHKLERGAKEYWEKYGTPEASLKLLGI